MVCWKCSQNIFQSYSETQLSWRLCRLSIPLTKYRRKQLRGWKIHFRSQLQTPQRMLHYLWAGGRVRHHDRDSGREQTCSSDGSQKGKRESRENKNKQGAPRAWSQWATCSKKALPSSVPSTAQLSPQSWMHQQNNPLSGLEPRDAVTSERWYLWGSSLQHINPCSCVWPKP